MKATTLNLYNSAIRFFYRNVLHILWDDITVPRMILEHKFLHGHEQIETTMKYLDITTQEEVKALATLENEKEQKLSKK